MEKTYSIPQLRTRLIDIVGTENFSTDSEVLQSYSENPYYPLLAKKRQPDFVVMPREVEEITEIIKVANKLGTPVVPRSSGLDPYGDAIPIFGGIMVDLANMRKTVQVEPSALGGVFARVEPGVTFGTLQAELKKEGVPVIYFVNNGAGILKDVKQVGADVIGIDWRIDIADAVKKLGKKVTVQGNLDPCALFLPKDKIEERVKDILWKGGAAKGHIFNLGHGILPQTPVENVIAMVEAVHTYGRST